MESLRGGEKEKELDKILNENKIRISVITESKEKLQETKETEHYTVICSGVDRHSRGQSGVVCDMDPQVSIK